MVEDPQPAQRRRRRRATSPAGAPAKRAGPAATEAEPSAPAPPQTAAPKTSPRRAKHDSADRTLRDLVGAGRSQLGVSAALRGRDVNRPSEQDLVEASETVVIVRRNWQPPAKR